MLALERTRPTGDHARPTQVRHEVSRGQRLPDAVLGPLPPARVHTQAPFAMQRAASGMSVVMTMSFASTCSAIQSSATSAPLGTTTNRIESLRGRVNPVFATKVVVKAQRVATRRILVLDRTAVGIHVDLEHAPILRPSGRGMPPGHLTVRCSLAEWQGGAHAAA